MMTKGQCEEAIYNVALLYRTAVLCYCCYMISYLPACVRDTSGGPVAWGVCIYDGQLGLGYTLKQYRRQHIGHAVIKVGLSEGTDAMEWVF